MPYHLIDLVDPVRGVHRPAVPGGRRRALAGIAARHRGALLVGGTGLYLRSLVDDLRLPGPVSRGGRLPRAQARRRRPRRERPAGGRAWPTSTAGWPRSTRWPPPGSSRPTGGAWCGPSRSPSARAARSPRSAPGSSATRRPGCHWSGSVTDPGRPRPAHRRAVRRLMDLGFLEEVRALAARPGGLSRTARQALGYRELLAHLEEGVPLDEAVDQAIRRTRAFARRQMAWFRRDPRIVWLDPDDDPVGADRGAVRSGSRRPGRGGRLVRSTDEPADTRHARRST